MKKKPNRLKRISLYPMKLEEALKAALSTLPLSDTRTSRTLKATRSIRQARRK